MFGSLGLSEMVFICAIALIVFGPNRLPGIARTLGRLAGQLRRMVGDVRETVEREIHASEFRGAMSEIRGLAQVRDPFTGPPVRAPEPYRVPEGVPPMAPEAAPLAGAPAASPAPPAISGDPATDPAVPPAAGSGPGPEAA